MKALSVKVFKRRFGLTQKELNDMVRRSKVEIQQNGYKGHSLAHHTLVVFPSRFSRSQGRKKFDGSRYGLWYRSQLRLMRRSAIDSFVGKHGYIPSKEELAEARRQAQLS